MRPLLTMLALTVASLLLSTPAWADATTSCIGTFRLSDGRAVDIAPSVGQTLRWRTFAGDTGQLRQNTDGSWSSTLGWTDKPDGVVVSLSDCAKGEITFGKQPGKYIAFDVRETTFESHGVKLAGRLVMPNGNGKVPIVILLHGSEHDSAKEFNALQRMFPAEGIGAFVYDQRGTGASGGAYTQDFNVLADDAVQAMKAARRLAGARGGRVGFQGPSEGGWIAPLAALRARVDFVIVSFGLAVTVLQEDQESVALDMYFHHRSADDTAKALQLARAGERVIETRGTQGYAQFDALRRKYKSEPWYGDVHGDFLFLVLPLKKSANRRCRQEIRLSSNLPLRAYAGAARIHHPAIVGAGIGRFGCPQCGNGQARKNADHGRKGLHASDLPRRRTRHDRIRAGFRWRASIHPVCTGLFRHDARLHPRWIHYRPLRKSSDNASTQTLRHTTRRRVPLLPRPWPRRTDCAFP